MRLIFLYFTVFNLLFLSCANQEKTQDKPESQEPVVTKKSEPLRVNCNDPDAPGICMFMFMPLIEDYRMDIPVPGEEQNLIITGKVLNANTKEPYAGIYLYAYHTDENGEYSTSGQENGVRKIHGKHHGWCLTDAEGNYEIHTRKPGAYPTRNTPAHIHTWIKIDDDNIFYINDFVFADDPLLNVSYLDHLDNKHNPKEMDNGVVELTKKDGKFIGNRDILIVE